MKYYRLIYLFFFLSTFSCKLKEELEPLYPPIGNTGAMAVSFYANGKHFYGGPLGTGGKSQLPYSYINYLPNSLYFDVQTYLLGTDETSFIIIMINDKLKGVGVYELGGI